GNHDSNTTRNARYARGGRARTRACGRSQPVWRAQLPRGVGMVAPGLDRREVGRPRLRRRVAARSGRAAPRTEIYAAQSLAHRAVASSGELWFAGTVA